MRNPLYHWSHMELKNPFGVTELLNEKTAEKIYHDCNAQLPRLSTQTLLQHYKVDTLCTTDDPVDSLEHHRAIANKPFGTTGAAYLPPRQGHGGRQPRGVQPFY